MYQSANVMCAGTNGYLKSSCPLGARAENVDRSGGTMEANLGNDLLAFRKLLVTEQGTEEPCPFCQMPRVRRSDYIRCNPCATNWLDSERNLPNYLNRNPAAARTVVTAKKPVEESEEVAK
jgi:hypothetical protein